MTDGLIVTPVEGAALDDVGLQAELLDLWAAVTDAGGSVGFSAPADRSAIAASLEREVADVRSGRDELSVLRDGADVIGMGFLRGRGNPLFAHWRTIMRLMVHPARQGTGAGGVLLAGLHDRAAALGCDHVELTVRDGQGLQSFYERHGYREVGRHPGACRIDGVDRDEIMFVRPLDR